jgi:hypothetical protein
VIGPVHHTHGNGAAVGTTYRSMVHERITEEKIIAIENRDVRPSTRRPAFGMGRSDRCEWSTRDASCAFGWPPTSRNHSTSSGRSGIADRRRSGSTSSEGRSSRAMGVAGTPNTRCTRAHYVEVYVVKNGLVVATDHHEVAIR